MPQLKTYASFATPNWSKTEQTSVCIIKAYNLKEAKQQFKEKFRNVEKVYSYK